MAGRSEISSEIEIVWEDTYNNPAGWLETNDEETNKPYILENAKEFNNGRVLLFGPVQYFPEKNVKAQLTSPEDKHSPPASFPYSSSKTKEAIVRVDIREARKKTGTWRLTVYNKGGAGVTSEISLSTEEETGRCILI